jgi:hypothetical protein
MQTDGLADGHDKVSSRCASCVRAENKTKLRCILTNPCNLPPRPTNLLSQQLKMPLTDGTADINVSPLPPGVYPIAVDKYINISYRVAPCAERRYVCLTIGLHNVRRLITAACSIFTLSFCPPFSSHIPVTVPEHNNNNYYYYSMDTY